MKKPKGYGYTLGSRVDLLARATEVSERYEVVIERDGDGWTWHIVHHKYVKRARGSSGTTRNVIARAPKSWVRLSDCSHTARRICSSLAGEATVVEPAGHAYAGDNDYIAARRRKSTP